MEAAVTADFTMLAAELYGEAYSKSDYRRRLLKVVSERLASNPKLLQLAKIYVERPTEITTVGDMLKAITSSLDQMTNVKLFAITQPFRTL